MNDLRLVTSGRNGQDGNQGYPGLSGTDGSDYRAATKGFKGGSGYDGQPGTDADDLLLQLSSEDKVFKISANGKANVLLLDGSPISVYLEARGGRGGHGGQGGTGGWGGHGANGSKYGSSWGGDGARGGDGGTGGCAGAGGNGGHVRVELSEADLDLLAATNVPAVHGGAGGMRGPGGERGSGGLAGRKYSWARHAQDGQRGQPGVWGTPGLSAEGGQDGSYEIVVTDGELAGSYASPYDLKLLALSTKHKAGTGILEPGETISVGMTVQNSGGMPLPTQQDTQIALTHLRGLQLVGESAERRLPRGLAAEDAHELEERIELRVDDLPVIANVRPEGTASFDIDAKTGRVNRSLPGLKQACRSITIQHAAHLSKLSVPDVLIAGSDASCALRIHNVAKTALGKNAESARRVQVAVSLDPSSELSAQQVQLLDAGGAVAKDGTLNIDVDLIEGGAKLKLPFTLRMLDSEIEGAKRVALQARLLLTPASGDQDMREVELRSAVTQAMPGYLPNEDSDFLLVTNEATQGPERLAWRQLARELGLTFCEWNVSLYDGYKSSLVDAYRNKTMVFLNQSGCSTKTPVDRLPSHALYHLREDAGIHVYIVGEGSGRPTVLPKRSEIEKEARQSVFCKKVDNGFKQEELIEETIHEKLAKDFARVGRERRIVLTEWVHNSEPGCCGWGAQEMARIRIIPMGSMTETRLFELPVSASKAHRANFVLGEQNVAGLLRTLPLERKLAMLDSVAAKHQHTLIQCLVAAMIDEQAYLRHEDRKTELKGADFERLLSTLNQLLAAKPQTVLGREALAKTCLWLHAYATVQGDLDAKHYFGSHKRKLSTYTAERVKKAVEESLELEWGSFEAYYAKVLTKLRCISPGMMLDEALRNPADTGGFSDAWSLRDGIVFVK